MRQMRRNLVAGTALLVGVMVAVPAGPARADGALAIDSIHGSSYGFAHDMPARRAEREALEQCGSDCSIVLRFRNGCGAYATDQSRRTDHFGWAIDRTRGRAERRALDQCSENGGRECAIRVWGCEAAE